MLENFSFRFEKNGRYIFVPNEESYIKGNKLLNFVDRFISFPDFFFHYRKGGHVLALHRHLENRYFFRLDIKNFFYSIGRNRVADALHRAGFRKARTYAKWSCVKNPHGTPAYALPIGFVQSPALASLVLLKSPIHSAIIKGIDSKIFSSIYLDDIICSSNDIGVLTDFYGEILASCQQANFLLNVGKTCPPSEEIAAFNCNLKHGFAEVTPERVRDFFAVPSSAASEQSFRAYCDLVRHRNL